MDAILKFVESLFFSTVGISVIVVAVLAVLITFVLRARKSNKCSGFKTQESCNNTSAGSCAWDNGKCLVK
jgi:hypothetical protein